MEDIIEIYEPLYRKSFNFLPILIILFSLFLIFLTFFLIKRVKNRKLYKTPEEKYQNVLKKYLNLQNSIDRFSSHDFSNKLLNIFKDYLSDIHSKDYKSTTICELVEQMERDSNTQFENLHRLLIEKIEPAQYGKLEIDNLSKNEIVKECVDYITCIYKEKGESHD